MCEEIVRNRFDLVPQELLDKIYGYLFDLDDAKVTKLSQELPFIPRKRLTYVLSTALLRVSRAISLRAQRALYEQDLLMLVHFENKRADVKIAVLNKAQHFPVNFVPDERSLPPCPIIVHHRRYKGKRPDRPGSIAIVIRAFDFPELCTTLKKDLQHFEEELETYSLIVLPKAGWRREQLRSLIWEPLKYLRHVVNRWCSHSEFSRPYYMIKAVDTTGIFEPTYKMLEYEADSQHEDSKCDDSKAYSHDGGGYKEEYEADKECYMCCCRLDNDSDDRDWSSEENSDSREDPDSKAGLHSNIYNPTSKTETLERVTLRADDEAYLGDDERGDDIRT